MTSVNSLKVPSDLRLAVIVDRYPIATETFIRSELGFLERTGKCVAVVTCSPAGHDDRPDGSAAIGTPTCWVHPRRSQLPMTLLRSMVGEPRRMIRLLALARSFTPLTLSGLWHSLSAVGAAYQMEPQLRAAKVNHIHAHFVGIPALLAKVVAARLNVSYSIAAHARDVHVPRFHLDALCRDARFIVACSADVERGLLGVLSGTTRSKVVLNLHGLDLSLVAFRPPRPRDPGAELRLISVCRLVPKKGVDTMLNGLRAVQDEGVAFSYEIFGDGPLARDLKKLARRLELRNVTFRGTKPHAHVLQEIERSDMMLLGSQIAADGDRDGIPNAVIEAMAIGVPVVASGGGGVPEIVLDQDTGLVVPPRDVRAFSRAVLRLAHEPALGAALARRARLLVERRFDARQTHPRLLSLLEGKCEREQSR